MPCVFGCTRAARFDDFWQTLVNQWQAQVTATGADAQNIAAVKAILISPEGRAGLILFMIAFLMGTLVLFAIAGGALGARVLNRTLAGLRIDPPLYRISFQRGIHVPQY